MKKYFISLENPENKYEAEISGEKNATINGKEFCYDYKFINDNILVLRVNNKNFFLAITEAEENNEFEINLESKSFKITCKSELEMLIDKMSGNKTGSAIKKEILSPMPGIIKSLNVKEGQKINKGEVLLVLEAMKMENEIKAVRECIIKKVNVDVLSSVEKNELLIVME